MKIYERIKNISAKEKANEKGKEIAKLVQKRKYHRTDFELQVVDTKAIDGGVEIFARAWKNAKQIGFGKDGTVDIERFRIFNPPILVDDENGDIIREWEEEDDKGKTIKKQRKLKEDPEEALLQSLEHTVKVISKHGDNKIVKGKIGRTTSTFYPAAGTNDPVDGRTLRENVNETFSTIRGGSGNEASATTIFAGADIQTTSTTNQYFSIRRSIYGFNTSTIPEDDVISSATFSLYSEPASQGGADNLSQSVVIDRRLPASASDITTADYAVSGFEGVEQTTSRITVATWIAGDGYQDFTLNATGIANIGKTDTTGRTWLAQRLSSDFDNSAPTWSSSVSALAGAWSADQTGTSKDPKLVVEHEPPSSFPSLDTLSAVDITRSSASLRSDITDDGGNSIIQRGFVFGLFSFSDPGDVSPDLTDYDSYIDEEGDFDLGSFSLSASSLSSSTTYYFRAFARTSAGYSYGDELFFDTLIAPSGVLTWGQMPKSQISDETIEEAINRLIDEHDANPEAHQQSGGSLEGHKQDDVIDHPAQSIVSDKYFPGSISGESLTDKLLLITTSFDSLDGFDLIGSPSHKFGSLSIQTTDTINNFSRVSNSPSITYVDFSHDMLCQYSCSVPDISDVHLSFGFGDSLIDGGGGVGVYFEFDSTQDKFFATFMDDASFTRSEILDVDITKSHVYRIVYISSTSVLHFYIDGVSVATIQDIDPDFSSADPVVSAEVKTLTSAVRRLYVGNFMFQIPIL